jgi:hypothetical protein
MVWRFELIHVSFGRVQRSYGHVNAFCLRQQVRTFLFSKLMSAFQWELSSLRLVESLSVKVIYADDMAARRNLCTVFYSSGAVVEDSNSAQDMDACVRFFCACFFLCGCTSTYMIRQEMFEVLTIFLIGIWAVWETTLCQLVHSCRDSGDAFCFYFRGRCLSIQVCIIASIFRTRTGQVGMHGPLTCRHISMETPVKSLVLKDTALYRRRLEI